MMDERTPEMMALYQAALAYEQRADHYNAVKLYKRIIKEDRLWAAPYLRLGLIYKSRREWKPSLHYYKKAIALAADKKEAWWNLGIAATALNKSRWAKNVWAKFSLGPEYYNGMVSIRLAYRNTFEVLGAHRIDPARASIKSIPHPGSGRKYNDILLVDNTIQGYHSTGYYRLPIYDDLGVYKASTFSTFSCILLRTTEPDIQKLRDLCRDAGLGFEVWANASRAYTAKTAGRLPEYFTFEEGEGLPELLVALAAKRKYQAIDILEAWKAISLKDYHNFRSY
jgi:tetratricopeptide (TPR) repeat protein